jgi:hypothetical protein
MCGVVVSDATPPVDNSNVAVKRKRTAEHECPYTGCKRAKFSSSSKRQQHIDFTHLGIENFVCDYITDIVKGTKCGHSCETPGNAKMHKQRAHSDCKLIAKYPCTHAGCTRAPFRGPGGQQMHIDFAHLGIRNFVCDYITDIVKGTKCGHACETPSQVTQHKHKAHSDVKPRECSVCRDTFKTTYNRDEHWIRAHSAADDPLRTQYKCSSCPKGFITSGERDKHRICIHLAEDDPERLAFLEQRNTTQRARYANDEGYRLGQLARGGLHRLLNKLGISKDKGSQEMLGCTYEELVIHLNNNTRGFIYGDKTMDFHIDHIRPIASFNKRCRIELLKGCNWNNLQLLPGPENQGKGGRFPPKAAAAYAVSTGGMAIAVLEIGWRQSGECKCVECKVK